MRAFGIGRVVVYRDNLRPSPGRLRIAFPPDPVVIVGISVDGDDPVRAVGVQRMDRDTAYQSAIQRAHVVNRLVDRPFNRHTHFHVEDN